MGEHQEGDVCKRQLCVLLPELKKERRRTLRASHDGTSALMVWIALGSAC